MPLASTLFRVAVPWLVACQAAANSADITSEISLPLTASSAGAGPGPQLSATVRKPQILDSSQKRAASLRGEASRQAQSEVAGQPEPSLQVKAHMQETGAVVAVPLTSAAEQSFGLGLGPQLSSRPRIQSPTEQTATLAGAQVPALADSSLGLGPQMGARVTPGKVLAPAWYVRAAGWLSQQNLRLFELFLLAVMAMSWYWFPTTDKCTMGMRKQRLWASRYGARWRDSADHYSRY